MLDIARLQRIKLTRYPRVQWFVGHLLRINYGFLPGVETRLEHSDRLPEEPVIFAMNHTDRYNYFPFQYLLWREFNRFTATWVKGKYYENGFVAGFMERTNQLPTISRGYLITKDFALVMQRAPREDEYAELRGWVDDAFVGGGAERNPDLERIPDAILTQPRNILGYDFDPRKEDYASAIVSAFRLMMRRFVKLNEQVPEVGLDMLIFPQGTRSTRLLPGHIGISQIALHLKMPIVPVGCNGSDTLYPGANPWAKKGRAIYRIGEPIPYTDLAAFQIKERFEPFSSEAETRYAANFEGVAALVTDRIEALLDEPYRRSENDRTDSIESSNRFL
jgi:1-acyl-sn-glycerol-3-phosphate acyltransferase